MSVGVYEFLRVEHTIENFSGLCVGVGLVAGGVHEMIHSAVKVAEHQTVLGVSSVDDGVGFIPKLWTVILRVCQNWSSRVRLV